MLRGAASLPIGQGRPVPSVRSHGEVSAHATGPREMDTFAYV
jgi:hypothetical protein